MEWDSTLTQYSVVFFFLNCGSISLKNGSGDNEKGGENTVILFLGPQQNNQMLSEHLNLPPLANL